MARNKQTSISEQLRQAIRQAERSGLTRYKIAKAAGIHQSQLTRLLARGPTPRADTADKIAAALGKVFVLAKLKNT